MAHGIYDCSKTVRFQTVSDCCFFIKLYISGVVLLKIDDTYKVILSYF